MSWSAFLHNQGKKLKKESFCEFLDKVSAALKGEKVYMLLDNCRMHHAHIVEEKMKSRTFGGAEMKAM